MLHPALELRGFFTYKGGVAIQIGLNIAISVFVAFQQQLVHLLYFGETPRNGLL